MKDCKKCRLHKYRRHIVYGRCFIKSYDYEGGDLIEIDRPQNSDVLIIGEAPGKSEDLRGLPFCGQSGRLFMQALRESLPPAMTIFITNTVGCRPTNSKDGDNRQPREDEVTACYWRLKEIITITRPKLVLLLGKVPQKYYSDVLDNAHSIYHPAFILRNGGLSSHLFRPYVKSIRESILPARPSVDKRRKIDVEV